MLSHPTAEGDSKSARKSKSPIPLWLEWNDADIVNEKWDTSKKEKERGRSPNAAVHYFEDPDGKIDLPESLKSKTDSWKRPAEIFGDRGPLVVDGDYLKESNVDLLTPNENITDSEFIRWFISSITYLWKLLSPNESNLPSSALKSRTSVRDQKDASKTDKAKKEAEVVEEADWKPWSLIWPKEGSKPTGIPVVNSCGKYAVKLHWMGCWRKIVVDDTIPCAADGSPLLPMTTRGYELWPLLLTKALVKVASLDYLGGGSNCEFGDVSLIHCLTGWLPEPIPLKSSSSVKLWKLLLQSLPNWTLPPPPSKEDDNLDLKGSSTSVSDELLKKEDSSKQELTFKDSKTDAKNKKDEKDQAKGMKDKPKDKGSEKPGDPKQAKDKLAASLSTLNTCKSPEPEVVLMASYNNPPKQPCRVSELKEMADASEKLRQFGLSHNLPHPVSIDLVRNCPLVAPPVAPPIPKWKLIRLKKNNATYEPLKTPEPVKEPQFIALSSPLFNYKVSPTPVSRVGSPQKWKRYKPPTPLMCLSEEGDEEELVVLSGDEEKSITSPAVSIAKLTVDNVERNEQTLSATSTSETSAVSSEKATSKTSPIKETKKNMGENKDSKGDKKLDVKREGEKKRSSSVTSKTSEKSLKAVKSSLKPDSKKSKDKDNKDLKGSTKKSQSKLTAEDKIEKTAAKPALEEIRSPVEAVPTAEGSAQGEMEEVGEGEKSEGTSPAEETKRTLWMDFDDFCQCFSTLWIFHKPGSYAFSRKITELKNESKGDRRRGLPQTNSMHQSGRNTAISPSYYHLPPSLDPPSPFLFIDNTEETEVLVSLSSLSRWFNPNINVNPTTKEEEEAFKTAVTPVPGVVIVEPYTWKKLVTGNPLLILRTSSTKGAVISLPPGRHVLRFMIQTPLGHHLTVCSKNSFVFGDEDSIMQHLKKESARFAFHSMELLQRLGAIIQSFSDPCIERKQDLILGSETQNNAIRRRHYEVLFVSLLQILKSEMGDTFTKDLPIAFEALKFESQFHIKKYGREKRKCHTASLPYRPTRSSPQPLVERHASLPTQLSTLAEEKEEVAAIKIQSVFRRHHVAKLMKCRKVGTMENTKAVESLQKIWTHIESKLELIAVKTYRVMFNMEPSLFEIFDFHMDEWNKIAYADYNGSYPEQAPNSWFIICREVFYVEESVLIVPKMYSNIPSCNLRVVNNDTGVELRRVFLKIAPQVLQPNKGGYTFLAEGRSTDSSVSSGKFRLRIIGSREPLPAPTTDNVNTKFSVKDSKEYYVPNRNKLLFRYCVKTTEDLCTSIQLNTSKDDVYIKLVILDGDKELACCEGKGNVVLPSFFFLKDQIIEKDDQEDGKGGKANSRTGSGRSNKGSPMLKRGSSAKRTASPDKLPKKGTKENLAAQVNKRMSTQELDEITEQEEQIHKYIIQASVVRDSWPLSKKQWEFIEDLKTNGDNPEPEGPTEAIKGETSGKNSAGKKKGKDARDSKGSKARPDSHVQQAFDDSKAHWILRVVVDHSAENAIEIKKDTERQDQINAIKSAWEAAEPGRAEKALASRMKYLEKNTIQLKPVQETVEESNTSEESVVEKLQKSEPAQVETGMLSPTTSEDDTGELSLHPPAKELDTVLKTFDATPYIRSTGKKVYLDDAEEANIQAKREKKFAEFKQMREMVLQMRERDRLERNALKEKQIQEYEQMQAALDARREKLYAAREAYRQQFIEKPDEESLPPPTPTQDAKKEKEKEKRSPSPKRKASKAATKSPSKTKKK